MSVLATSSVTLAVAVDVSYVETWYILVSSLSPAPVRPTTESPSGWSTTEPAYTSGSTDTLYSCQKTVLTDNTFWWGTVTISSSYEAAKQAYNAALAASQAASDVHDELVSSRVWYATCDTAAATVAKVATITPTTTEFSLRIGVVVYVTFSITNSGNVANLTLSVNGTTAKKIQYTASGGGVANLPAAGYLAAGRTYQFVYDGTNWVLQYNYNTNTTYNLANNPFYTSVKALSAIDANRLIVGTSSGYVMAAANVVFDISYPVLWCTKAIAVNGTNCENVYLSVQQRLILDQFSTLTKVPNAQVYLVGTLSGSMFTIASTPVTCALPNAYDGLIYMSIGQLSANSTPSATTDFMFVSTKNIYAFVDGAFKQVDPATIIQTQQVYYRSSTAQANLSGPSTWVSQSGDVYAQWTTKVPPLASSTASGQTKYPYLYSCTQSKRLDGVVVCTTPTLDESTTVIDGGNIITNTVTAEKLDAADINASNSLTIGAMTTATQSSILNSEIQVGGRNLLLGTAEEFSTEARFSEPYEISELVHQLDADDILTVSFEAKASVSRWIDLYWLGYNNNNNFYPAFQLTTDWVRYEYTGEAGPAAAVATYFRLRQSGSKHGTSATGATIYIRNMKLERGNKPTDWTPAPEDIDGDISDAAKTATNYIFADSNGIKIANGNPSTATTYQRMTATANQFVVNGVVRTSSTDDGTEFNEGATAIKASHDVVEEQETYYGDGSTVCTITTNTATVANMSEDGPVGGIYTEMQSIDSEYFGTTEERNSTKLFAAWYGENDQTGERELMSSSEVSLQPDGILLRTDEHLIVDAQGFIFVHPGGFFTQMDLSMIGREVYTPTWATNQTPAHHHCVVAFGICHLFYQGASTTHSAGALLMTLPEGCRPSVQTFAPFIKNANTYGTIAIDPTTGQVTVNHISSTSNSGRIYFNMSFPVASVV